MGALRAGAAKVVITPPVGTGMAGYSSRAGVSQGVHDDLHAKAIVFDDGETQVALVTLDLVGMDRASYQEVRADIEARTGIPADHIMFTCSHTHSGPTPALRLDDDRTRILATVAHQLPVPKITEVWTATLLHKLVGLVDVAWRQKQPAKISVGRGEVDSISYNRRRAYTNGLPIDPEVGVILMADMSDRPMAVLMNFSCHPVIMRDDSLLISADYPGAAMRFIEDHCPTAIALFAQGACGNIDPRPSLWGRFENVRRAGTVLGAEVLGVVNEMLCAGELKDEVTLKVVSRLINIPLMKQPDEVEATRLLREQEAQLEAVIARGAQEPKLPHFHSMAVDAEMTEGTARAYVRWAETLVKLAREGTKVSEPVAHIQALAIGDGVVVGAPVQMFVETSRRIKDVQADGKQVFFFGCTNGFQGYVPAAEAFAEGGYEVTMAQRSRILPVAPEASEVVAGTAIELVKSVVS